MLLVKPSVCTVLTYTVCVVELLERASVKLTVPAPSLIDLLVGENTNALADDDAAQIELFQVLPAAQVAVATLESSSVALPSISLNSVCGKATYT